MYEVQHVVVPTDFSNHARAAAARALELARYFATPIHLVHALRQPTHEFALPANTWAKVRASARERLEKLREQLEERGGSVSATLRETDPVGAIEAEVRERSATLITMGTHGFGGLKHMLLGSATERTLRATACPVLCVQAGETDAERPIRRILLGTDFSAHSESALGITLGLAKRLGAAVEVVHSAELPIDASGAYSPAVDDKLVIELRGQARRMLEAWGDHLRAAGLSVRTHLTEGAASEALGERALSLACDLIVMGARGNTALGQVFLGTVAERMLRTAPCPVLAAKALHPGIRTFVYY